MSAASCCDACSALFPEGQCVQLEVRVPDLEEPGVFDDWSKVDICPNCLNRPLRDLLLESCHGITPGRLPQPGRPA